MAKAAYWTVTDVEARRRGEQTGLDTLVVHAVNDDYLVLGVIRPSVPSQTLYVIHLGSTFARMKLKGIDGDPHKRWSMWFNSIIREEPYPLLTYRKSA